MPIKYSSTKLLMTISNPADDAALKRLFERIKASLEKGKCVEITVKEFVWTKTP